MGEHDRGYVHFNLYLVDLSQFDSKHELLLQKRLDLYNDSCLTILCA